jgi:hypothetical protein
MPTIKAPIHISNLIQIPEEPGVYIWGFMYDKHTKKNVIDFSDDLLKNFNPDSHQFIPYYVGEAYNLQKRLGEHALIRSMDAGKYVRFRDGYDFWMHIPRQYSGGKYIDQYREIAKDIQYYGECSVMLEAYPHLSNLLSDKFSCNRQPSINDLEAILGINDILEDYVHNRNNFWFLKISQSDFGPNESVEKTAFLAKKQLREDYESLLYLSLKGRTIGRCYRNRKITNSISVIDLSKTNVFYIKSNLVEPCPGINLKTFQEQSPIGY